MKTLDLKGLERVIANVREEIAAVKPKKAAKPLRFQRGIISYFSEPYVVYRNIGEMRLSMPYNKLEETYEDRTFDFSNKQIFTNVTPDKVISNVAIETSVTGGANNTQLKVHISPGWYFADRPCVRLKISPQWPFIYFNARGELCGLFSPPAEGMLPPLTPVIGYPHKNTGTAEAWGRFYQFEDWQDKKEINMRWFFEQLFESKHIEVQRYRCYKKLRPSPGEPRRKKVPIGHFRNHHGGGTGHFSIKKGVWRVRRIDNKKRKSAWVIVKINSYGIRIEEPNK